MTCITEILKLKGDKKILLQMDDNGKPWLAIEGGGTYKGYEYLITFTDMGHRCGYVAVPSGHKLDFIKSEKRKIPGSDREYTHYEYDVYDIDCHGGITFCERNHSIKNLLKTSYNDLWLGFDCAHAWDGKDLALVKEYYGDNSPIVKFYEEYPQYLLHEGETMREFDYVERECKSIIEQLIQKEMQNKLIGEDEC